VVKREPPHRRERCDFHNGVDLSGRNANRLYQEFLELASLIEA